MNGLVGGNPHGVVLPSNEEDQVRHLLNDDLLTSPEINLASHQKGGDVKEMVHVGQAQFLRIAHGRTTEWLLRLVDAVNHFPSQLEAVLVRRRGQKGDSLDKRVNGGEVVVRGGFQFLHCQLGTTGHDIFVRGRLAVHLTKQKLLGGFLCMCVLCIKHYYNYQFLIKIGCK